MTFSDLLLQSSRAIRGAILRHPFVVGIGDGSLPLEKFQYYVRQDYVYLIDYSPVLALASARAPDLPTMGWFARLLDETLNTEMALHRGYCGRIGVSERELEETKPSPTTLAYTRFLLHIASQGSFGELAAGLLPCQYGYWEIGDHLARQGEPTGKPLYCEWIRMYSSTEFRRVAEELKGLVARLGALATEAQRPSMTEAYMTSLRYEYLFWEASWNQETWPV